MGELAKIEISGWEDTHVDFTFWTPNQSHWLRYHASDGRTLFGEYSLTRPKILHLDKTPSLEVAAVIYRLYA